MTRDGLPTGMAPGRLRSSWRDFLGIGMRRESRTRGQDKLQNWVRYDPRRRESRLRMVGGDR